MSTAGGIFVDHVVDYLVELGYATTHGLLNAMDFGVPQDRTRFFLIACRCGMAPALPVQTHRKRQRLPKQSPIFRDFLMGPRNLGCRMPRIPRLSSPVACETVQTKAQTTWSRETVRLSFGGTPTFLRVGTGSRFRDD